MAAVILSIADLILRDERLFVLAVPAGVLAKVDVVGDALLDAPDHLQHPDAMPRLGGADEIVVGDVQFLPQLVIVGHHAVGQLDRQHTLFRRGPLDFLSMLVGAGEEPDVVSHAAPMAGDHIRHDVLVHVSDVRDVVDVVNGRGDVKLLGHEGAGL